MKCTDCGVARSLRTTYHQLHLREIVRQAELFTSDSGMGSDRVLLVKHRHAEPSFYSSNNARGTLAFDHNDVFEPSISQESFGDRTVKSTWPKGDQWNRSIFFQRKVGRSKPPKPVVAQNRVGVFHILGQYLDDGQVQLAGSEPCPYNAAQPNTGMDAHATVLGAEAANDVCNLIDLRLIVAPQTYGAGQLA